MSLSDADIAFATDLLAPLGGLSTRKMFGGLGIYRDGTIFALLSSDGRLYLKAAGDLAQDMRDDGAEQFHTMPYWSLPEAALDDPAEALDWANRAVSQLQP